MQPPRHMTDRRVKETNHLGGNVHDDDYAHELAKNANHWPGQIENKRVP